MNRLHVRLWLVALAAAVFASPAAAEGPLYWHPDFPKPGVNAGSIDVAGKILLKKDWTILTRVAIIRVSKKNGSVISSPAPLRGSGPEFDWRGTIEELESGETYNVRVEILASDGATVESFETEEREITTK